MQRALVSVIIPAYNNAEFLGETIQSVLKQTYPNFEIMVVNDASPDHVNEVIQQFADPRIRYIVHEKNLGLSAARNTGIRASKGDLIALLDGDDLFHPEKLRLHVEFLAKHPAVGVTYNARFELNHSANTIRELWRPPTTVTLADLVCSFPFSPSDMVLRREWAFQVGLFDEYHTYVGEDLDINCRLALAGCQFASVDRALNYRRYHAGRIVKNLRASVNDTLRPLNAIFQDARCPHAVLRIKEIAYATHLLLWSVIAFMQEETALGQTYCREALHRNPAFLVGEPSQLIETFISYSIADESVDHEPLLQKLFAQLPPEVAMPAGLCAWAVARGYLLRGTRATMWGQTETGCRHFERAGTLRAKIDELYLHRLTAQLLDYEMEYGSEAAKRVLQNLSAHLGKIAHHSKVRWLRGHHALAQAFQHYRSGNYAKVPRDVIAAYVSNPQSLTNRGALSILVRSLYSVYRSA